MTEYIAHRINRSEQLAQVPPEYGVELDLRPYADTLIVEHDPFVEGELFSDYLQGYRHGTLILNIKSEGIEPQVLELVKTYGVERYFLLDCSFPKVQALTQAGERNVALRFSEYEGLDMITRMAGRADWVWVDGFTRMPLDRKDYDTLRALGFKLCLVSPELHGRPGDIPACRDQCRELGLVFDAICTKLHHIALWKQ